MTLARQHAPSFQLLATRDCGLFAEYTELRRRVYLKEYPWLPASFGHQDEMDPISRVVLAMQNGEVRGGARLTVSTPERPMRMPLEEGDLSLKSCGLLANLNLEGKAYGEISRMAVEPACAQGFQMSFGMADALCEIAAYEGLDGLFCICPEKPARIYAINAQRGGVPFHRYREVMTGFGVKMWLCGFTGLLARYANNQRKAA